MNISTPSFDAHWVSIRHVQRAVVLLQAMGIETDGLLARAGLDRAQLMDANARMPLSLFENLFSVYEAAHGDAFMGLRMANEIQPSTLGILGHLLQSCATLADLLDVFVRFRGLMSSVGAAEVIHTPGRFEVCWSVLAGSVRLRRQACEYVIGTVYVLSRLLVPSMAQHFTVRFPHPAPDKPEQIKHYFDFFGCPVYFDCPHASITASSHLLQLRLPHGDAVLKDLLERHAQLMLERQAEPTSLADDVRRLIKSLVLSGEPTKETVARQLGTSTRSLHRRLEESGTSYRELLDAVRLAMAQEALVGEDVAIADLAERLSFSSPQAFMRWFKALSGATPGQYRSGKGVSVDEGECRDAA